MNPTVSNSVRIDVWLWAARFFKTRALAKIAIETGKVQINGQKVAKPSRAVRIGDIVQMERPDGQWQVQITGLSVQRGPAVQAQQLYVEDAAVQQARKEAQAQRRAQYNGYQAPESKPDKRARRLLRALGDINAL